MPPAVAFASALPGLVEQLVSFSCDRGLLVSTLPLVAPKPVKEHQPRPQAMACGLLRSSPAPATAAHAAPKLLPLARPRSERSNPQSTFGDNEN